MSNARRLGLLAAAIAVVVAAFVIANPGGGDDSSTTTTTAAPGRAVRPSVETIRIRDARPVGGIATIRVSKGDTVRFRVVSDTADEIHVHGYDLHKHVAAGGSVTFAFRADSDGEYEVELENHKQQIAELTIEP
jgi:plastocyanin